MRRRRADINADAGEMRVWTDQPFVVVTMITVAVMLMAKHSKKIVLTECRSFGVLGLKIMHYLL